VNQLDPEKHVAAIAWGARGIDRANQNNQQKYGK
jgi:hypothetical protein